MENLKEKLAQHEPTFIGMDQCHQAAVCIPLLKNTNGGYDVLFEVRAATIAHQPGDVCLPGGMVEDGEEPREAVLRELQEELLLSEEQIHYLGQYLSTKSVYADFLKSTNKKDFRQNHADEIAKYEEALQFLKQNSPDGKLPTMKDLRSEKELLVQQKSAQYETYQYFRDYHRELQTVCENVNHILDASQTKQQEQKKSHQSEHSI